MVLDTRNLARCIATLELSLESLRDAAAESIEYEVFRNAVVKGFELTLETAGKLLRFVLKEYVAVPHHVDAFDAREVVRALGRHGVLTGVEVERWFARSRVKCSTELTPNLRDQEIAPSVWPATGFCSWFFYWSCWPDAAEPPDRRRRPMPDPSSTSWPPRTASSTPREFPRG